MAAKPNISKLYDKLFDLREALNECVAMASEIANEAEHFGGEVSRVLTGQIRQTLIPGIQQFTDNSQNPASAGALISFMDSVPLAWVRGDSGPGAGGQGQPIAQGNAPNPTGEGAGGLTGDVASAAGGDTAGSGPTLGDTLKHESAILRSKQPSIREALAAYDGSTEGDFGDKLDFKKMAESYRKPRTGSAAGEIIGEDRIFSQYLEKSAKPSDIKRLDEDILAGAYKMPTQEEIHSMDNWRDMVENTTPLRGLDAGELADAWGTRNLSEEAPAAGPRPRAATPAARMQESGIPPVQPMEGDVMSDILNFDGNLA